MNEKLMPQYIENEYEYKETLLCGATKDIPLSFQIDIFKHKSKEGNYAATEIKSHFIEYQDELFTEETFRKWTRILHVCFSHSPSFVEEALRKNGKDMKGNPLFEPPLCDCGQKLVLVKSKTVDTHYEILGSGELSDTPIKMNPISFEVSYLFCISCESSYQTKPNYPFYYNKGSKITT